MSTRFWSAILARIVLSIGTAAAAQVDLGIITGSEKGTYYQLGLNPWRTSSPSISARTSNSASCSPNAIKRFLGD